MRVDLTPFVFIGFCTAVGALAGNALAGVTVGLGVVLAASVWDR